MFEGSPDPDTTQTARQSTVLPFLSGALLAVGVLATSLPNLADRVYGIDDRLRGGLITGGWVALIAAAVLVAVLVRRVMPPSPSPSPSRSAAPPLQSSSR